MNMNSNNEHEVSIGMNRMRMNGALESISYKIYNPPFQELKSSSHDGLKHYKSLQNTVKKELL